VQEKYGNILQCELAVERVCLRNETFTMRYLVLEGNQKAFM
jgi:hypothetical protein